MFIYNIICISPNSCILRINCFVSQQCEEPHNAQTDLDLACEFYFPGLVESINQLTVETDSTEDSKASEVVNEDFKVHSPVLPPLMKTDSYPSLELAADAMKGAFYSQVIIFFICLVVLIFLKR